MAKRGAKSAKRAAQAAREEPEEKRSRAEPSTSASSNDPFGSAHSKVAEHRQQSKEKLDTQIELFKEHLKNNKIKQPDFGLLNRFFDKGQISALWMRLKSERSKSDMSVSEAWEGLKNLKTGANKIKNDTLMNFLILPPDAWQERLLTVVESFKKTDKKSEKAREYSRGELEQIHGAVEADDYIKKGKYKSFMDDFGDEVFVKVTRTHVKSAERINELKVTRNHRVTGEVADQNIACFDDFFKQVTYGTASGKVMKKPAAIKSAGEALLAICDDEEETKAKGAKDDPATQPSPLDHAITKVNYSISRMAKLEVKLMGIKANVKKTDLSKPILEDSASKLKQLGVLRGELTKAVSRKPTYAILKPLLKKYNDFDYECIGLLNKAKLYKSG